MTANQLRQRRLLLMQDEANLYARLRELEEERVTLERALQRTVGARLECDYWIQQQENTNDERTQTILDQDG